MINKNPLRILTSILVVAAIAVLLYVFSEKSSREIPTIYPDNGETKIRPSEIGGIVIPNSENTIYESLTGSSATTKKSSILSEPEQPIIFEKYHSMKDKTNIVANADSILSKKYDKQETNNVIESIFDDELMNTPLNQLRKDSSNKNRTLNIIKYDKGSHHKIEERNIEGNAYKNYMVQLASVKSEAEGNLIGERIKQKHRKILEPYSITLKKVKAKDGQFFYLVFAGNCPNISTAKTVCKKLSYRQQSCIIFKS